MEPNPLYFIFLGVIAIGSLILLYRLKRKTADQAKEDDWAQKAAVKKAVEAGTHNEAGKPLCRICGDHQNQNTVATQYSYHAKRDEGFRAWVRARIGAPARYKVVPNTDADKGYCREHAMLVEVELRGYLLEFESRRLNQVRDAEVEISRHERKGLDEAVRARVEQHERDMRREARPNKVVGINS